ncbi:MAG: ATP synthase F1 subunit gamma [Firmicutes bacterium]|nr:ATP synthase F1 subunit gamma [Bacillota bacterium]
MASTRAIRRRIKSVGGTQQITRAMNLVAASKLQRARQKLESARPFYQETRRVIESLAALSGAESPFLRGRPVRTSGFVVIAADRGLCGGYNVNVCKLAGRLINEKSGESESIVTVGSKSRDYFRRRRKNIVRTFQGISETPFYEDAAEIGHLLTDSFESGEMDEIYLVYTEFKSVVSHVPRAIKLLPVEPDGGGETRPQALMNYEPNPEELLALLIPKYVNTVIYGAMAEASACEQGARMTGMDAATKNSRKLIAALTLEYNRARQGAITQEINEIVGGANAL